MMMFRAVVVILAVFGVKTAFGKVFQPSELSRELQDLGVSEWDIPLLVCHAHQVSGLRTDFNETYHDPEDNVYGIFGLKAGGPGGNFGLTCGLTITQLTDDDIADDVGCLLDVAGNSRIKDVLGKGHAIALLLNSDDPTFVNQCIDWWGTLPPTLYQVNRHLYNNYYITEIVLIAFVCFILNLLLFCLSVWLYSSFSRTRDLRSDNGHISFTNLETLNV